MTGSTSAPRWLAEALAVSGVTHVFFVPELLTPMLAALEGLGVRRVSAHSEVAAAYMADGYARASRRPGICMAQSVGSLNLAAGLREPFLGCAPVIAVTGGPEPRTRYRLLYQEVEDFPAFEPVTKMNARVERADRVPDLLSAAFRVATTGTPGPVHLELPGRLGEALEGDVSASPFPGERYRSIPPHRPSADPDDVMRVATLLARAARPVIVAGGGVTASGAETELLRLAEATGIPVATSLNAKGAVAEDHPLALGILGGYGRSSANRSVADADLVFFVGTRAGGLTTDGWKAPPAGTAAVQLDLEPSAIGRNYPVEVALVGDARTVLRQLLSVAEPVTSAHAAWAAEAAERTRLWRAAMEPSLESEVVPIRPERLCRELTAWMPEDAMFVADTGYSAWWGGALVELRYPAQRFIRCAGTLGWSLPGAIGAKCALPDRPVVCLVGDGGIYYHLSELETAARLGINVIVVVNDNAGLGQTIADYDAAHGHGDYRRHELWQYRDVNLARVAEEMGCLGIRVDEPAQLSAALRQALGAGRPTVVDVSTDPRAVPPKPWPTRD